MNNQMEDQSMSDEEMEQQSSSTQNDQLQHVAFQSVNNNSTQPFSFTGLLLQPSLYSLQQHATPTTSHSVSRSADFESDSPSSIRSSRYLNRTSENKNRKSQRPPSTPYENGRSQSSSTSSRRTNTDKIAAAQMNGVADSNFESLFTPNVLSHIANLVAQTNATIFEESRKLLNGIPITNSVSHLKELLLQIDNGSRYYILSMYRGRQSIIQQFLHLELGINTVALEQSKLCISSVSDDTEKKNALLNALYSGSFAQGPTTEYTFIQTNSQLTVVPPLWHIRSSTKDTEDQSAALGFLVRNFPLFTSETMDQFISKFRLEKESRKRLVVNILIQYYFFDKCMWSPTSLKVRDYYSIGFGEFNFLLIPNYCPIQKDGEGTVLAFPLKNDESLKPAPTLIIGGVEATLSGKVGRGRTNAQYAQLPYKFPRKDTEQVVDATITYPGGSQTRTKYVTYYRPEESSQSILLPSTTTSNSISKEKNISKDSHSQTLTQVSLNNSTIQNRVLHYKSEDLYEQSPYHHQVYKNQLDDKHIDNLSMFDRKVLFCFDEDNLGRTPFQLAFAVSNIITIEKMLPKLFDATKIEDRIELIYHLYKVNEFGEWAAGLALKNIKVEYEMLREYLAMTYQIIIPQEAEDEEDDEEDDETLEIEVEDENNEIESSDVNSALKEQTSNSPSFNSVDQILSAEMPTTQTATVEQEDMNYPIQYKKYWFPLKYYSARLVVSKNKTTNEYEVKIYAPKSDEIYFSANNVKSLKWTVYNSKTNEYILNLLPSKHSFYIKFESNSVKVPIASSSSANNSPVSSSPTQKKSLFPASSVSEYVSSTNEGITTLLPTSNPLSVLDSVPESKRFVENLVKMKIVNWSTKQVSQWLSYTRIIENDEYIPLSESKVQSETLKQLFESNYITGATLMRMKLEDLKFLNFKESQIVQLAEEIELLKNENIDNSQLCYMTLKLDQEQENRSATEMYELYKQRSALVNISQFKYYFMNIDTLSQLLLLKLPIELIIYEHDNKVKYGLFILSTWFLEWNDKSMLCIPQRKAPSLTLFRFTIYWVDNQKEIIEKLIDTIVKFIVDRNANENLEDKNGMSNIQFVKQLASKTQMSKGLEIALQHWQYSSQNK